MSITLGSCIKPVFPFIRVKMAIFVACIRDTKHLSTVSALVILGTDSTLVCAHFAHLTRTFPLCMRPSCCVTECVKA